MPVSEECMEALHIKGSSSKTLGLSGECVRIDAVHDGCKVSLSLTSEVNNSKIQVGKDPQISVAGGLKKVCDFIFSPPALSDQLSCYLVHNICLKQQESEKLKTNS